MQARSSLALISEFLHGSFKTKYILAPSNQSKGTVGVNYQIHIQSRFFPIDSFLNLAVLTLTAISMWFENLEKDAQNMTEDDTR